ncbi:Putative sodium-coupled neutral amino acid transporter 10, partial [Dufourea novaeangliae]
MISQLSHVMTLANSIIGVSVLAMPFCFKQCGIILAALVLLLSSLLSRLACHFLIKSAVMSRRRNFELLAFHAFGHMGKFLVELFIIGFLVGTCIAFFVVMGDLGPQIVGKVINKSPHDIRTSLLVTTSIFIVLPLGLLRNIDSLSSFCTAAVIFYLCLVLKIVTESMQHIFAGDWYEHVYYWRPSGILQCIPIFSMALFCQTQLFEIYETIPNVSLEKMNDVVRGALNICTIVYLCVGFFGYIAFCTQPFTGNILMSFKPSLSSEMIKMGFVFSIAFSFPLVIFPCRASLNSLLFRRVYAHEPSINYLPELRFRCLTIAIVAISMITGILIPNIEFVLGLVGSTIGVMICLIFPAIFFISISSKHTNERLLAQVILFTGICIMILSTYANLYALEESSNTKLLITTSKPINQINNLPLNLNKDDINAMANIPHNQEILPDIKEKIDQLPESNILEKLVNLKSNDIRQEPPIPVERIIVTEKPVVETQKPIESVVVTLPPIIGKVMEEIRTLNKNFHEESKFMPKDNVIKTAESVTAKTIEESAVAELKQNFVDMQKNDNLINFDAIKKEEAELAADADIANVAVADKYEKLTNTNLKTHKEEFERQKQRIINNAKELGENERRLKTLNEKLVIRKNNNSTDLSVKQENEVLNKTKGSDNDKDVRMNVHKENSFLTKDVNSKTLNNKEIKEEKGKHAKERSIHSKDLPRGPILNALMKRRIPKSKSSNELVNTDEDVKALSKNDMPEDIMSNLQEKSVLNSENQKAQYEYSLPIALKMHNQTKMENASVLLANKSEENIQVLRRDILENHERDKREVNLSPDETDTKVMSDISGKNTERLIRDSTIKNDRDECSKQNKNVKNESLTDKSKMNENQSKSGLIEMPLIKVNMYLSEQKIANSISVDPDIAIRGEYVKLKQRDLKSVDSGED